MAKSERTQVAVLGGGPGGYAAAFAAADHGLEVTIVEARPRLGGVCLQEGCIPSKALLHVAALIHEARDVKDHGVTFGAPKIDVDQLRSFKEQVIGKMTSGLGVLAKTRKVRILQGRGELADGHTLMVTPSEGEEVRLSFEYCILATGSHPFAVPGLDLESPRVWDSTAALELREVPKKLLVVGGGYIGAELATVYAALGSKVTIVELTPGLLPGADRDLVRPLQARLKKMTEALLFETKVTGMKETKKGVKVTLEGKGAKEPEAEFDAVLVSIGRAPNTKGIGLENTRVQVDGKGFVQVDLARRTSEPSVFAIGDISGQPMLAHKASHEARVAAEAVAGKNVAFEPQAIPAVVFTDPEIAWTGLTETEAEAKGQKVQVARYPWAASGRAVSLGRTDGVTKVIVDPDSKRVLGIGIAGAGAGELIAEATHAIEMGALAEDLALTIHPHPTLSETISGAAELIYGHSIDYYG